MKIAYVVPGAGGGYYCENCLRDVGLFEAFSKAGHELTMIPMYLPLETRSSRAHDNTPVFFGAVDLYLGETSGLYRRIPAQLRRILDTRFILKIAAELAGTTRSSGLEELTLSMLRGEDGRQTRQLGELVDYVANVVNPDIVHISNCLLEGLSRGIKQKLNVPVICSLQDEDEWIEAMSVSYQDRAWALIAERLNDSDAFIAPSNYYLKLMKTRIGIPEDRTHVIPLGIEPRNYRVSLLPSDPPVLGYLNSISQINGFETLVLAFMRLKDETPFSDLRLHVSGGLSRDNRRFLRRIRRTLSRSGALNSVRFFNDFSRQSRAEFLSSLSVLSVPMARSPAFGYFQLEALASGVPVVVPGSGAFAEFHAATGGSVLYDPVDKDGLVNLNVA